MMPSQVVMREVGARDGIQSLGAFVATSDKIALVDALSRTGLTRLEATSFVHPTAVPQMADAAEVMAGIRREPGVCYEALVPNLRGAQDAIAAGVDALALVLTASELFNQKNVRMSVDQSLEQFARIKQAADAAGVPCIGTIGTAFGCPYEGEIPEARLLRLVERLVDEMAMPEVILADTTGIANPAQVERTMATLMERWGDRVRVGLHFHNTRGMGLANVLAGLRAGVRQYDASIAGIGGCPFAPQAAGNISTEDTVHMLQGMGLETRVDLMALVEAARLAQRILGRELPGQVMKAGPSWQLHPV